MMIMLLLSLVAWHPVSALSPVRRQRQANNATLLRARRRNLDIQDGEVALVYQLNVQTFIETCTFPSVDFVITCNGGGRFEFDEDGVGLGLHSDEHCTPPTNGGSSVSCSVPVQELWNPGAQVWVVFSCIGTSAAQLTAQVVVRDVPMSCAASSPTHLMGRDAALLLLCRASATDSGPNDYQAVNRVVESAKESVQCQPQGYVSNVFLPVCSDMTIHVDATTENFNACIWTNDSNGVSSPLVETRAALYYIVLQAIQAGCTYGDQPQATIACGPGGRVALFSYNQNGEAFFVGDSQLTTLLGCQRQGMSGETIVCDIPPTSGPDASVYLIACTGDSTEAVAMSVELDPNHMTCYNSNPSALVSYNVQGHQVCESVVQDPLYPTPWDIAASFFAHTCSPTIAYRYEEFAYDVETDDDDDDDDDNINTNPVAIPLPYHRCDVLRSSCYTDSQQNYCDMNGGQDLAPVRMTFAADRIRQDCLTDLGLQGPIDI
eukprot:scaffold44781_cov229-Amphora_coffeaeformis.AAC.1